MAITRWDPLTALAKFDREFDELVRRGWGGATQAGFVPPVEILRRDTDVLIRLELPGVDVERDVDVQIDKGRLVIKGERRDERTDEGGSGYLLRELRYGSFRREFALPEGVTAESVEANYDHGMLEVVVHDVVRKEPEPQQVKINTSGTMQAIEATTENAAE